jgi:deoxyribodipyrimidine photo-lyase
MINIFWFRRDLRLEDNAGLITALTSKYPVLLIFILDKNILNQFDQFTDPRVAFIHSQLISINDKLINRGSSLQVYLGYPIDIFRILTRKEKIHSVYTNCDYEPYAIKRDNEISKFLASINISFHQIKDQVIFDSKEVLKENGEPYRVYTPYRNQWLKKLQQINIVEYNSHLYLDNVVKSKPFNIPSLNELGYRKSHIRIPGNEINTEIIRNYHNTRDFPAIEGTTRLGVHLRFGTISIRKLVLIARELNNTFLNELIWREFYMMIIYHFPHVEKKSFKSEYDQLTWSDDPDNFDKWCNGNTGIPLIDAGMRQLNQTGYMHNRLRMITASFLTKHLLIDWRLGEAYFASKLLDFELSSNNGGWQWAAGTGTDAQPYFRIFNPYSQTKKFDPELIYIRKWVPEYGTPDYIPSNYDLNQSRKRSIEIFRNIRTS